MALTSLSSDSWKEICLYLDTESALKLLATGNRHFSVFFSLGVLPLVDLSSSKMYPTLRKTLVYLLHNHRHLQHFKITSSQWEVAIPFLGAIVHPSALKTIIIHQSVDSHRIGKSFLVREEDQRELRLVPGTNISYQSFERFCCLTDLRIHYPLPAARSLSDYTQFWVQFFAALPQTLQKLLLHVKGYSAAIQAIDLLPTGLNLLHLYPDSFEGDPPLTVDNFSTILTTQFPQLASALLYCAYTATVEEEAAEDVPTSLQRKDQPSFFPLLVGPQLVDLTLLPSPKGFPRVKLLNWEQDIGVGPQLESLTYRNSYDSFWFRAAHSASGLDALSNLPSNLTCLDLDLHTAVISKDKILDVISALPVRLETLSLSPTLSAPGMEALLPRKLQTLTFMPTMDCWNLNFAELPPSLTVLRTTCWIENFDAWSSIPTKIKTIHIGLSPKAWYDFEVAEIGELLTQRRRSLYKNDSEIVNFTWEGKTTRRQ